MCTPAFIPKTTSEFFVSPVVQKSLGVGRFAKKEQDIPAPAPATPSPAPSTLTTTGEEIRKRAGTSVREEEKRRLSLRGRRSTILTGGSGLLAPANIQRKELLGA